MQLFSTKLSAWAAVAALGAVGLFGQAPAPARARHAGGKMVRVMATYLNLTPAQTDQVKSIFRESGQSAKPLRQELRTTRNSLRDAVKAGDSAQIQKLTAAEGSEKGQLAAIRATAFSKVYKVLTPEQQQKLDEFQKTRHGGKARG